MSGESKLDVLRRHSPLLQDPLYEDLIPEFSLTEETISLLYDYLTLKFYEIPRCLSIYLKYLLFYQLPLDNLERFYRVFGDAELTEFLADNGIVFKNGPQFFWDIHKEADPYIKQYIKDNFIRFISTAASSSVFAGRYMIIFPGETITTLGARIYKYINKDFLY